MAPVPSPLAVVLVHGSFHGAWCWDRLTPLLTSRGLIVETPELPTVGDDVASLGTFDDDVAAVAAALDRSGPALVCAHSYGGLVAGALDHPNVRRLAFVAALIAGDVADAGSVLATAVAPALLAAISFDETVARPDADCAGDCFYGDCDRATADWAQARLRPQSTEPLSRPLLPSARADVPTTYIVCARDGAVLPDRQREMAARCTSSRELDSCHSPMLSVPGALAQILVELATGER